jgi:hypothetical protein
MREAPAHGRDQTMLKGLTNTAGENADGPGTTPPRKRRGMSRPNVRVETHQTCRLEPALWAARMAAGMA